MPAVSLTVNTEPASATEHVGDVPEVEVTAQALPVPAVASTAMPEPDSVMTIPALAAAVMAVLGVNENVAVVCVCFILEESVVARPITAPFTAGARTAKMANAKVIAFILLELNCFRKALRFLRAWLIEFVLLFPVSSQLAINAAWGRAVWDTRPPPATAAGLQHA